MKKAFIIYIIFILFFSACGVKDVHPSDDKLSQQFDLKITQKDNPELYKASSNWLGTPYKIGGNTKKGIDCSGFVNAIYKEVYKKTLNRSSAEIFRKNIAKVAHTDLREGDLVFFRTDSGDKKSPNHVGIYLKDGKFVHASTSKGVIINSLDEPYYKKAWISGGRVK